MNFEANGIIGSLSIPYQIEPIYDGCTDSLALNYNPNAIINDGSCIEVVLGCTDESSYNFNPLANTDDQSCIPDKLVVVQMIITANMMRMQIRVMNFFVSI